MENQKSFTAIIQSPNDERQYRVIKLSNNLSIILISDSGKQ